ncbi:uncharacterized protein ACR2FA_002775 [Aphomia sociella]
MMKLIPITLSGNNLGERHRHLNSLVNEAFQQGVPFESVQDLPERTAIDRLFKIDLASKHCHVQYIMSNLKNDDMLYVSRALKCRWLLAPQYRDLINPAYLEDVLFPEMVTTAVNKMKHWISLHLRDPDRCQEFFQYYQSRNIDLAIKFLWQSTNKFISSAALNILDKLTPQHMKVLCEKCPQAVKVYFEMLPVNQSLVSNYLNNETEYYSSLKCLLKIEADLFLDIIEKYFNVYNFKRFSAEATRYVIDNHKNRFINKSELYTAWLLDIKTLAECLNTTEIKEIIVKLARAKYLESWFGYKHLEPLILKLPKDERASFKNQVFVDKSVGELVEDWPYLSPCSPAIECVTEENKHVFVDKEADYTFYDNIHDFSCRKMLKKRKYSRFGCEVQRVTLNGLFDKYRFASFKKTLLILQKQMLVESSSQIREYMMLVLISKSGGYPENIQELLELLLKRHANEPPHIRAAVVRSMVKRAKAWRFPTIIWQMFLKFAQGLGLDDNNVDVDCHEYLHAAVLRYILSSDDCPADIFAKFLDRFTTFTEYDLDSKEKKRVLAMLPNMLIPSPDEEPEKANTQMRMLLDVLDSYHIRYDHYPGVLPKIILFLQRNSSYSHELLDRLFNARIGRKELFLENFKHTQTNESYLNALRHDSSLLLDNNIFCKLIKNKIHHDGFLRKLSIYFSEPGGIAENFLTMFDNEGANTPRADLARPVAFLAGASINKRLLERNSDINKRFATALWTNAHLARPKYYTENFNWDTANVVSIANIVLICRNINIDEYMYKLLADRRTVTLGIMLAFRSRKEGLIFFKAVSMRPLLAIKHGVRYIQQRSDSYDPLVWEAIKPAVAKLDLKNNENLQNTLADVDLMPPIIKVDYSITVYNVLRDVSKNKALTVLRCLERLLPDVDEKFIVEVVKDFIDSKLTLNYILNNARDLTSIYLHLQIIIKHLLLCQSEELQKEKMASVGDPFLNRMKSLWMSVEKNEQKTILYMLDHVLFSLKYSYVFLHRYYVSSLPIFERVAQWMQEILPVMKHFDKYVKLHLTMLYCKSIRQGFRHRPEIFSNPVQTLKEGVAIVGTIFGKCLAHEINELKKKYYDSIVELYGDSINKYLMNYFYMDESTGRFVFFLLKGFLDECHNNESRLLAAHIFSAFRYDSGSNRMYELLKQIDDIEMKYYLNANL